MMGGVGSEAGIIPRFCRELFDSIQSAAHGTTFEVAITYYEIYKEDIFDLLVPQRHGRTKVYGLLLHIRSMQRATTA